MMLKGLNAVVTGGGKGIGESIVRAFAREGANVAIADRGTEEAKRVGNELRKEGINAIEIPCDVSSHDDVKKMADIAARHFGSIDILVNNAGIAHAKAAIELTLEDWQRMMSINLTSVFLCSQTICKKMIEKRISGSIINICSMSGHVVNVPQRQCHYNAAKGGVLMLTKSLAVEWAEHRIRVNSISPGYIGTALTKKVLEKEPEMAKVWIERTPLGCLGEPEDVAEIALYLASSKAKYVTGSDWIVDGGYTCP